MQLADLIRFGPRPADIPGWTPLTFNHTDEGRALFRLLSIAVAVSVAASIAFIALFFWSLEDAGLAALAVPFVAWAYGYVVGGAGLVVVGLIQLARRRVRAGVLGWALLVYAGPATFLAAALWLPVLAAPLSAAAPAGTRSAPTTCSQTQRGVRPTASRGSMVLHPSRVDTGVAWSGSRSARTPQAIPRSSSRCGSRPTARTIRRSHASARRLAPC